MTSNSSSLPLRTVVITAGLPGAGKSTLCAKLTEEVRDAELISSFKIRAAHNLVNVWSDDDRDSLANLIAERIEASSSPFIIVDCNLFRRRDREAIYAACTKSERSCVFIHITRIATACENSIGNRSYVKDANFRKTAREAVKWVADHFDVPLLEKETSLSGIIRVERDLPSVSASWRRRDSAPAILRLADTIAGIWDASIIRITQINSSCPRSEEDRTKTISSEALSTTKYGKFSVEALKVERSGRLEQWNVVRKRPSSNIVAIDPNGRVLLIREWKGGFRDYAWGLPGGEVDTGEDPWDAGFRELREECGVECRFRRSLYKVNLAGSTYSGMAYLSIGTNIEYVPWIPESEDLQVGWFGKVQVVRAIENGEVTESAAYFLMRMMIDGSIF